MLAAAVVAVVLLWGGGAVAGVGPDPVPVSTYTVVTGETWWSIASIVATPGEDVRDVVRELITLNGQSGSGLQAGQQILLPIRA